MTEINWLETAESWFKRYEWGYELAEEAMWRCLFRWASGEEDL